MVGTLGLSLVLVALTQLCGGQVDAWIMPAAFLLAGAGVFLLSGGSDAAAAKSIARRSWFVAGCLLVQVAVWGVALWLAGCTYDYSVDGVSYHQDAVYAFFRGCNFYLHSTECGDVTLWTRHYAKGMEMMQACVMAMTGNIESGRAVNLVLATATGLLLWHVSGRLGSQLLAKKRALVVGLAVANPVFLCQALTFYIDFAAYFYILVTICAAWGLARGESRALWLSALVLTVFMAVATKFNAFFYEGLTVLAIAYIMWRVESRESSPYLGTHQGASALGPRQSVNGRTRVRPYRRRQLSAWRLFLFTAVGAAVVGTLLVCYHPYVTNTLHYSHPLYPLMGRGAVDIMGGNTAPAVVGMDRFSAFVRSYLTPDSHSATMAVDQRVGGFGPFSLLLFVLSWGAVAVYAARRKSGGWIAYTAVVATLSCFCFAQSWWARYVPQLWLVVPLGYLALTAFRGRAAKACRVALVCLTAVTLLLSLARTAMETTELCARRGAIREVLAGREVAVRDLRPSQAYAIRQAGIRVRELPDSVPLAPGYELVPFYSDTTFAKLAVPTAQADSIRDATKSRRFLPSKEELTEKAYRHIRRS